MSLVRRSYKDHEANTGLPGVLGRVNASVTASERSFPCPPASTIEPRTEAYQRDRVSVLQAPEIVKTAHTCCGTRRGNAVCQQCRREPTGNL